MRVLAWLATFLAGAYAVDRYIQYRIAAAPVQACVPRESVTTKCTLHKAMGDLRQCIAWKRV